MIPQIHESKGSYRLYLEPWEMPEFYDKHRQPRAANGMVMCAKWILKPEMVEWLNQQQGLLNPSEFQYEVFQWDMYVGYHLEFRSMQDLVLFKLRWGGQ